MKDSSSTLEHKSQALNAHAANTVGQASYKDWSFLIAGTLLLIIGDLPTDWVIILFILLFVIGMITIYVRDERIRFERLVQTWSELAQQTALELSQGDSDSKSTRPRAPSLRGAYRCRRVSVTKAVEVQGDYESSFDVVLTCISLQVKNAGGYYFYVASKTFLSSIFKSRGSVSGDSNFDKYFSFDGRPKEFVQKICQLIVQHPILLDRPDSAFKLTDDFLWLTTWNYPSIKLLGSELFACNLACLQIYPARWRS